MELRDSLRHVLIAHDEKESKKKFYNPNALGIYMEALQSAWGFIEKGADVREVLCGHFCGSLLAKLLKATKCEPMSKADNFGQVTRRVNY